jgi:hypothetical protein
MQARGLEYVHLERVGPRTFAFTSTLNTGPLSSSFTLDSSPRVDRGRGIGPGVRTLTLTVSAVFATSPLFSFFCTIILVYLLASQRVRIHSSFFSLLSFSSVQFSICDTPVLSNRWSFKSQVLGHQLANSGWTLGRDYKGVVVLCCTIRIEQGKVGTRHCFHTMGRVIWSLEIGVPNLIDMADGHLLPLLNIVHWYVLSSKLINTDAVSHLLRRLSWLAVD